VLKEDSNCAIAGWGIATIAIKNHIGILLRQLLELIGEGAEPLRMRPLPKMVVIAGVFRSSHFDVEAGGQ
jgi:hypothetical protein